MNYYDEIQKMVASLPEKIETLKDIRNLPWGGNAAWDCPIILHFDRVFLLNESLPRDLRKKGYILASFLMTGEGRPDDEISDADFDECVALAKRM